MSGLIRQSIGRRKSHLVEVVVVAKQLQQTPLPKDNSAKLQLNKKIKEIIIKIQKTVEGLEKSDGQWVDLVAQMADPKAEEVQYSITATASDGYLAIIDEANELVALLQLQQQQLQAVNHPDPVDNASHSQQTPKQATTIKLPKLDLPSFDGDFYEWPSFWTIFQAAIHNTEFSGVQKFSYLRSYLQGQALDCISGIALTNNNYELALTILKSRFERSAEQLLGGLYSKLKRLPTASNQAGQLRKTYDSCTKILRQLETNGEDINSNRSLVLDVLSKYPSNVLKEICRHKQVGAHSKLSQVQQALKEHLDQSDVLTELLDDVQPFTSDQDRKSSNRTISKQSSPAKQNKHQDDAPTESESSTNNTSAFTATEPRLSTERNPSNPCYFCSGLHFNAQCQKYPTLERRLARLSELKRCGKCLRFNHTADDCRTNKQKITCFFCRNSGDHPSPLCPSKFQPTNSSGTQRPSKEQPNKTKSTGTKSTSEACSLSVEEQSVLSTAVAFITNPINGQKQRARIIFDNGSHRTYITEQLATNLGLVPDQQDVLTVSVFGTDRSLSVPTKQVQFEIQLRSGGAKRVIAHTTSIITKCELSPVNLPSSTRDLLNSMQYAVADDFKSVAGPPSVLIGSDYFWEFLSSGSRVCTDDGIYLIPTTLGLVLGGRYQTGGVARKDVTMLCLTERANIPHYTDLALVASDSKSSACAPDIDEYWSLETIGISDKPTESDDDIALKQFQNSVYFENGRYQVAWPWKAGVDLPTNYKLATGRLQSLVKRLGSSPDVLREYTKLIDDQLKLGIVEDVPAYEPEKRKSRIHYLPHHPVIRTGHATTKIRIVYDASSRCRKLDMSLNQCLYRGPLILPNLCSILIRFRLSKYIITSDIEKAFLQLSLQQDQRDVTRFLWLQDPNKAATPDNLRHLRFARVPFGVISSPFLLGATIQHHLSQFDSHLAMQIKNNIYVDNVLVGVNDVSTGSTSYTDAKDIFKQAGMNLREFCSNSPDIFQFIPKSDQTSKRTTSVLGLTWDSLSDTICLKADWRCRANSSTKRQVLQAVACIYDPLGYFQPSTLAAKCFLRELWAVDIGWDVQLGTEFLNKWAGLHEDIAPIFQIQLPRRVIASVVDTSVTLVVFSDASAEAYATSVYLRMPLPDGTWDSQLIFAKSRLAPRAKSQKDISIPRLELLGVTIGVRAVGFVREALQLASSVKVYALTDSTSVLGWLGTRKLQPRFIENRIAEIRKCSNIEFSYVQSEENPADISTRGLLGSEIEDCQLWWRGPLWLRYNRSEWPQKCDDKTVSDEDFTNIGDLQDVPVFHTLLAGEAVKTFPCGIDPTRYSKFANILRVTVWCLKAIKQMLWNKLDNETQQNYNSIRLLMSEISENSQMNCIEIEAARLLWIKFEQANCYSEVITSMETNKPTQLVHQLGLVFDERKLLRCNGRLEFAELPPDALQPMLLKRKSVITDLIIKEYHEKLLHAGVSHTLNEIRRRFWIPQGRTAVRNIITRCLVCKRCKGPPFALPRMPAWPRPRVSCASPFQFTGVDYFGPIKVSLPKTEEPQKMWACLFTCLAVRAVHIEWVSDCTAHAFIDCLSRFISRRGCPQEMISDNAPQFKLTKNLFDKTWISVYSDDILRSYIAEKHILWRFTTELAPWKGGCYERLIGLTKSAFTSVVGRRLLSWSEFATLITEVEAMMNSRPLMYVGSDFKSGVALRPVDFLTPLPTGTPEIDAGFRLEGGDAQKYLTKHWKVKQRKLHQLWNFWQSGYLTSLRERYQTAHKNPRGAISDVPREHEVVLVKGETNYPRGTWKLGRVTELFSSDDGSVRAVELLLPNRQLIRRPVNHIYRLEVASDSSEPPSVNAESAEEDFDGFTEDEVRESENRCNNNTTIDNVNLGIIIASGRLMLLKQSN